MRDLGDGEAERRIKLMQRKETAVRHEKKDAFRCWRFVTQDADMEGMV